MKNLGIGRVTRLSNYSVSYAPEERGLFQRTGRRRGLLVSSDDVLFFSFQRYVRPKRGEDRNPMRRAL